MLAVIRMSLGPHHPDVEDLLQDSLAAFLVALHSFRWECTVLHYACRIALQRTLDARKRFRTADRALVQLRESAPGTSSHFDQVRALRRRALLRQVLAELPREQAEALLLRHALGYTVDEIAGATHAPKNTVRSRLRLAKTALRRRILNDEELGELKEASA
jgi:RNA polymerase sigma-70 factor (ECF subfamily)